MKKKNAAPPFEPFARIYEEEGHWFVHYQTVPGRPNTMRLDAETREEAKFEAANLTDIPEAKIGED